MTNFQNAIETYEALTQKIASYHEATGLVAWDMRTGAPKKGIAQRSEVLGTLSEEGFLLQTSDAMKQALTTLLASKNELSEKTRRSVEESKKTYDLSAKIPAEKFRAHTVLCAQAESAWEGAKVSGDFASFQPYLEKIVANTKEFLELWGYEGNPYNTLMDQFEPGITVETVDRVFGQVREAIVPLLEKIKQSPNAPETDFLFRSFPQDKQKAFSLDVLKSMGYDFDAGRLDTAVHPFAIGLNPNDVRVTTKYDEKDFRTAVFGTIHEGGHALYEQNISEDLIGSPLCSAASYGIHESQSLFWENFVGRDTAFWDNHYTQLKTYANEQFDNVSQADFYRAINVAGPSLIRIEADELTYCLHIMVRYEIEKGLFDGTYEVKDLPAIWNDKMEEYLGIRPENDAKGVLQDVHWAGGSFGYFPSYALGYIYAAQFAKSMESDFSLTDIIQKEELGTITSWLTKNVHQHGKMKTPSELVQDITGGPLDAQPLIDYLTAKYTEIYKLD
ncbi:carboxypeptidase M32 [Aureibacillus halotolerans]|uniref:Metal-dependent carboxypeptidase n=1 Tax=Aureibacillus halotolerans TaxID=1508390 RepID=A0A4V6PWK6_9BACI|nr:carboxypeptidase M32 [Aureibacillus halotolerans]TDQ42827.1 carboxypeptidase Taq [Aureibacillus halotolerans]